MPNVQDAVEFLRKASENEAQQRQEGLECLKFRYGDQWPTYAINSRGMDRPRLTINEINTYVKKVTNAQRQMRPRGKASPVDNFADKKIAKVITGLGRHIEVQSDADNAYDTAFDFAATIGWGYLRLFTDYVSDESFSQEIYIGALQNPFSVYYDWNSVLPDGSDAERALITTMMGKESFRKKYPGAEQANFEDRGAGDTASQWITQNDIRLAEYFYIERVKATLVALSNGQTMWADDLEKRDGMADAMVMQGISILGERESFRSTVKWCKQTAVEILEEKVLPGRWIPVVPVYWTDVQVDSRRIKRGLVYDGIDPARMVNFWNTSITEYLALAPKAKWLVPEGTDEGHENEFNRANLSPSPVLRYKPTDVMGQPAKPERIAPEPPPAGLIEATFMATQNLSRVMGVFDPAVRGGAQHKSDKTLNAERGQSEMTNFDGYDNLTRSIKHVWRIILSWVPEVYDTQRVLRIIGEDGREEMVTLNERQTVQEQQPDGTTVAVEKILNDVCVGEYDVVMETGPGYDTLRKEGAAMMIEVMKTPMGEAITQTSADLVMRQQDFPGSDLIADRLAAANPLSQIDEKSDVPPQAQMMIKQLQSQLKQAGQQIQALTLDKQYRLSVENMKQEGETKRTLMKTTADSHDTEVQAATKAHDVESKAETAMNIEEIRGIVTLLAKKLDIQHGEQSQDKDISHSMQTLDREIAQRDREQQAKHAEQHTSLQ